MPHSSTLSCIKVLIRLPWDWMTEPCSTISMVIRLYEITNKTVSTGKRLYFFLGFFGAAIAIPDVLPNKVVKWHPGLKAGT